MFARLINKIELMHTAEISQSERTILKVLSTGLIDLQREKDKSNDEEEFETTLINSTDIQTNSNLYASVFRKINRAIRALNKLIPPSPCVVELEDEEILAWLHVKALDSLLFIRVIQKGNHLEGFEGFIPYSEFKIAQERGLIPSFQTTAYPIVGQNDLMQYHNFKMANKDGLQIDADMKAFIKLIMESPKLNKKENKQPSSSEALDTLRNEFKKIPAEIERISKQKEIEQDIAHALITPQKIGPRFFGASNKLMRDSKHKQRIVKNQETPPSSCKESVAKPSKINLISAIINDYRSEKSEGSASMMSFVDISPNNRP